MSHIDYLIDKVVLLYLKEPIEYTLYDDVYSFGVLTHHHKRQVFHQFKTVIAVKVKDITFFGLFVQPHRSIELVNIEFSNIERISINYKWVFEAKYNINLSDLEKNSSRINRFVINVDADFVEWEDNKEPNLEPKQEDNDFFSPDIRSPFHEDNQDYNDSE